MSTLGQIIGSAAAAVVSATNGNPSWMKYPTPPPPKLLHDASEADGYRVLGNGDMIAVGDEQWDGEVWVPNGYVGRILGDNLNTSFRRPLTSEQYVVPPGYVWKDRLCNTNGQRREIPYGFRPLGAGDVTRNGDYVIYDYNFRLVSNGGGDFPSPSGTLHIRRICESFGIAAILNRDTIAAMKAAPGLPNVSAMILNELNIYPPDEARVSFAVLEQWVLDNYKPESVVAPQPAVDPDEDDDDDDAPPIMVPPAEGVIELPFVTHRLVERYDQHETRERTREGTGYSLSLADLRTEVVAALENEEDIGDLVERVSASIIEGADLDDLPETSDQEVHMGDEDNHETQESSTNVDERQLRAVIVAWCQANLTPEQRNSLDI